VVKYKKKKLIVGPALFSKHKFPKTLNTRMGETIINFYKCNNSFEIDGSIFGYIYTTYSLYNRFWHKSHLGFVPQPQSHR